MATNTSARTRCSCVRLYFTPNQFHFMTCSSCLFNKSKFSGIPNEDRSVSHSRRRHAKRILPGLEAIIIAGETTSLGQTDRALRRQSGIALRDLRRVREYLSDGTGENEKTKKKGLQCHTLSKTVNYGRKCFLTRVIIQSPTMHSRARVCAPVNAHCNSGPRLPIYGF